MSWLYSRALVEEYLAENCSVGELFAPLNGNLTQLVYLPRDKMTAYSRLSQYGMTFQPLTENLGEELLTWYLEGSRARTLVVQEKEPDSTVSGLDYGLKCGELLARYDQNTSSWKTAQLSLFGGGVRVIGDLAEMGYDCKWGVVGANSLGGPVERERLWIACTDKEYGETRMGNSKKTPLFGEVRGECPTFWLQAPSVSFGVEHGLDSYMDQVSAIGNGQVPAVVRLAWNILNSGI